jgi:outer membrane murein-binding lipoprotein Lpp
VSLLSDAFSAIKSIVLVEERVAGLSSKVERLAVQVDHLSTRVTRLETIVEINRPEGAALKIAPQIGQMTAARFAKDAKE